MDEERQPRDPTRKLLKVFGVRVTQYEERVLQLVEQATGAPADQPQERLRVAMEALDLTQELNARMRDMYDHVMEMQVRLLADLRTALESPQE